MIKTILYLDYGDGYMTRGFVETQETAPRRLDFIVSKLYSNKPDVKTKKISTDFRLKLKCLCLGCQ